MSKLTIPKGAELTENQVEAQKLHHRILANGQIAAEALVELAKNLREMRDSKAFKELVKGYMDKLSGGAASTSAVADSNVIYKSLGIAAMRKKADTSGEIVGRCVKDGYYVASQVVTPATGTQQWFRHAGTDLYSALTDTPAGGGAVLFEKYGTYTVGKTTDCVNVRAEAGTDRKIITALPKGTEVNLTGEHKTADGLIWAQVVYDGKLTWMAKQWISV